MCVSLQNNSKTYRWALIKFSGNVDTGIRNRDGEYLLVINNWIKECFKRIFYHCIHMQYHEGVGSWQVVTRKDTYLLYGMRFNFVFSHVIT